MFRANGEAAWLFHARTPLPCDVASKPDLSVIMVVCNNFLLTL
jgi:hypothetical protein